MSKFAWCVGLLLAGQAPAAAEPRPKRSAVAVAAVDRAVAKYMDRRRVPGLSLAIILNGRVVMERAYGYSDLENRVRATPRTVYRLASISKPITAVAVMQLVEAGKLDLDATIGRYVPTLPATLRSLLLRDLLRHTSGVRHYRGTEFESTTFCPRLADGLAAFVNDPLEHEPGAKQTYSTYGYTLLGLAVEAASRMRFADYVGEKVFRPAGMTQSRADDVRALIDHRSSGYAVGATGAVINTDLADTSCKLPGGGFVSTAMDMARFDMALNRGVLLSAGSLATMTANQVPVPAIQASFPATAPPYAGYGYGYGWIIATARRRDAVWHGGIGKGSTTVLYRLPHQGGAIVVLSNLEAQGEEITELADDLGDVISPR